TRACEQAVAHARKAVEQSPGSPEPHTTLAQALNHSALIHEEKDLAGKRRFLEEAIEHQREAARLAPKDPARREGLGFLYWNLAPTLTQMGDHAEAARAAAEIYRCLPDRRTGCWGAARFLARCAALAEKDDQLTEPKRKEVARSYADGAMKHLREAV